MPAIVLKSVPHELHRWLKGEAERNRRSMTQQLLLILEQARSRPLPPVPPPARIKTLKPFTQVFLRKAIEEGRS
jgi:hypothetical protein